MTGGRRRRLGWVWAGLGAVAVSAVGFAVVAQSMGERTQVWVLARDVPAGQVLKREDLRVVQAAAETGVVPVADRATVLGRKARVPLVAGALLAPGQVGTGAQFPPPGHSQVAIPVESGGTPPDLSRGERVAVLPGPSEAGAVPEEEGQASPSAVAGTVTGVRAPESAGGPSVVTVLVETAAARRAAQLEHPRVVVLPAEGREAP
ncbi:SAF domain-containing protein [Streptomyces sp. 2333.5]|uniref:SAF domain-containing protein n=1 Tax=unclassified Streptomyces TaxID=2593676 RepID=UPI00089487A1|nr:MULTISPECIES: SAF domain-containing protein [unclassified Streptomyces]PJJ04184.1 SAF domain-containing protein [Streptomyces sp. 2333.5]SEE70382.1 SAF domain-containing protein [Streptomyces sp. 2112.2]